MLFTEHDMDAVFAHADRILVLVRGEIIAAGSPDEVRANARVREVYLGDSGAAAALARRSPGVSALLEVEGLSAFYGRAQVLFDVSLALEAGEVVALMGRNGAGKTTTLEGDHGPRRAARRAPRLRRPPIAGLRELS